MDFSCKCKCVFVCKGPIAVWLIAFGHQIDHPQRQTVYMRASFLRLPIIVLFFKTFLV